MSIPHLSRRTVLSGATALLSVPAARAATVEKPYVDFSMAGVGAQYLAVPVAQAKGFFDEEGLHARIETFQGGGGALEALLGGSTDMVAGYYDHTVQMQAKGKYVRGIALLDKLPGLVLAVRIDLADQIKTIADLKGRRVGVTDLGGASFLQLKYLASRAGLDPSDITVISVGTGATSVAAVEHKAVEALMAYEPGATMMEQRHLITSLIDARTVAGTMKAYGTLYPAACLYTTDSFIQKNPDTTQRVVNAAVKALRWMNQSSPEQIAEVLPKDFTGGDHSVLVGSIAHTKPGYPTTGRFDPAVLANAVGVLATINPAIQKDKIDVARTFTNRFVDAVAGNAEP